MGTADAGLAVLRVGTGLTVAAHGAQKLFGWFGGGGREGTTGMMGRLGFEPAERSALAAGIGEFGGGLLLAAGAGTPIGSTMVTGTMIVAASTQLPKGFFVIKGGIEYPAMLALVAASLALTGPGSASVDNALRWRPGLGLRLAGVGAAVTMASVVISRRRSVVRSREAAAAASA
ncbi:MAG: DoxX family protein [Actinomycetota bacterium]|nr:MAG: DoxX family protein [Actinomycetota bacterium]